MKNNIEFYQHYANADMHGKFMMLRAKYGWAGDGQFWAINNRIAQADNCTLDLSKNYVMATMAHHLDFTIQALEKFIKYLVDECDLLYHPDDNLDLITSEIVQENYKRVTAERDRKRGKYKKRQDDAAANDEFSAEKKETAPENADKTNKTKDKVKDVIKNNIVPLVNGDDANDNSSGSGNGDLSLNPNGILSMLKKRGVDGKVAGQLIIKHDPNMIWRYLMQFDYVKLTKPAQVEKNPGGYLRDSIAKGYDAPAGFWEWYNKKHDALNAMPTANQLMGDIKKLGHKMRVAP